MDPEHLCLSGRILLVAAHPDDESIGAGGQLHHSKDRVHILHATDGAPLNPAFARDAGFGSREEYARARTVELRCAVSQAGIPWERCRNIGLPDQDTVNHLPHLTEAIASHIDRIRPDCVLTHAYEGGHPDHDSCAFACRVALATAGSTAGLWEFTSYHTGPDGLITGEFLGDSGRTVVHELDEEQRTRKRRMFGCHGSQARVLDWFRIDREKFRAAPGYDFTRPPHEGRLHYETLNWGIDGARWRERVSEAMEKMGAHHVTYRS